MQRLPKAVDTLKTKEVLPESTQLRQSKYIYNRVEQDYRFPGAIDQPRDGVSLI